MKNRGVVWCFLPILCVVSLFYFMTPAVFAEEQQLPLPGPISDFMKTLEKVKIDGINVSLRDMDIGKFTGVESQTGVGVWDFIKNVWDSINSWMIQNIGISFSEVIRAAVNLIVWVIELALKLIKAGLNYLPV